MNAVKDMLRSMDCVVGKLEEHRQFCSPADGLYQKHIRGDR